MAWTTTLLTLAAPAVIISTQVCLFAYTNIVLKCLFDTVAKQVQFCMVEGVCGEFVSWMLTNMDDTEIELCLAEDVRSKRKRGEIQRKLAQFREGLGILSRMKVS